MGNTSLSTIEYLQRLLAIMSGKSNAKEINAFPQGKKNQDLLQRLNHLYQANTYLASLANDSARTTQIPDARARSKTVEKGKGKDGVRKKLDTLGGAVRKSNHRFKVMVKHNILATYASVRLISLESHTKCPYSDPSLKRSLCTGCNTICIPGHNARVRVKRMCTFTVEQVHYI
jgi:ribonuclease P protein subunit RPR2